MAVLTAHRGLPRFASARSDLRILGGAAWKPLALGGLGFWLLVVGAHHEPWVDEAQAWLLARDSSLGELLFQRVRYEGSPGLWHALLWVLIRAGLPYAQLHVVSTICALCGGALILWRSPFPIALRLALLSSYVFAYQYAIVARSYALDLVLLPALATVFARRVERPFLYALLIGLLANCNAHSFFAAAILGCEFALALLRARGLRAIPALAVAAGLGLFALACAWQPADVAFPRPNIDRSPALVGVSVVTEAFVNRLLPWRQTWPTGIEIAQGLVLSLMVLALSLLMCFRAKTLPLAGALIGALVAFSTLVYFQPWHAGLLFLVWLFVIWISWSAPGVEPSLKHLVGVTAVLLCLFQAIEAAASGVADIERPYSAAPAAAAALAKWHVGQPGTTLGALGFMTTAVQPFFASNIFANDQGGNRKSAYITWKAGDPWKPFPEPSDWHRLIGGGYDLLLVSARALPVPTKPGVTPSAAGYHLDAIFPGTLIWKGYTREDDTLFIFVKNDWRVDESRADSAK